MGKWWVIADTPGDAMNVIGSLGADVFPCYFGWRAVVERVAIAWSPDYNGEEDCIVEERGSEVEAWRITLEDR